MNKQTKSHRILSLFIIGCVTLFIGIIYWTTMAPSVVQIDSGELAAVQCTTGIAHPTGYPLFTLPFENSSIEFFGPAMVCDFNFYLTKNDDFDFK